MPSIDNGLPQIVLLAVPVPSFILLCVLTLCHLTPLLSLLPNIRPSSVLHRLSTIIPHPRRNLPREFFNLPPRPGSPSTAATLDALRVLGVRGKVVLLLCANAVVSLVFGWAFLGGRAGWWAAAVASTAVPSAIATLAVFSICTSHNGIVGRLVRRGGITHNNLFSRILPVGSAPVILVTAIAAGGPSIAPKLILAFASLMVAVTIGCSVYGLVSRSSRPVRGHIRLASPECEERPAANGEQQDDSWLTSYEKSSGPISAFSFSPAASLKTPAPRQKPRSTTPNGSPTSWISSPTNTLNTLASWEYSPSVESPPVAHTRQRTSSPIPDGLPRPLHPTPARNGPAGRQSKASQATSTGDHTMLTSTTFTSPGGSILAGYEPDPFVPPPPRGFASLTSYPLSPSQMGDGMTGSRSSLLTRAGRSRDAIAFIPEERMDNGRISSTWTLETYQEEARVPVTPARPSSRNRPSHTPKSLDLRAPPPPPMPANMPLPPTPTFARSETAVEFAYLGKGSREWLIGERDWVQVDPDVDGLDEWSREGRGVGLVAVFAILVTHALAAPMFINGLSSTTQPLYLVSLLLPAPLLAFASYLLRYRPAATTRERAKKSSTKSTSTHRSLALTAASELSLPISLSPKLTPPNEKRATKPNGGWARVLEPKPSVSNFGLNRPRPFTVYGDGISAARDCAAEEQLRKSMTRRSGEIWIKSGHAIAGGNRWSRTAEMLKPVPAMRALETCPPSDSVLKKLRGGVVSMLPKRVSQVFDSYPMADMAQDNDAEEIVPSSPVTISITSPSKFERGARRQSALSTVTMTQEGEDGPSEIEEGMTTLRSAEIQVATRGRMSTGPVFFRPGSSTVTRQERESYDLDWMTAGVLPGLLPNLKIGSDVRVGPSPTEIAARRVSQPNRPTTHKWDLSIGTVPNFRGSLDFETPSRHGHTRGYSSSIDFGSSPDFAGAMVSTPHGGIRNRSNHTCTSSLPSIPPCDFTNVRRSIDGVEDGGLQGQNAEDMGMDLPPIPSSYLVPAQLSAVDEAEEGNESSLMRATMDDMRGAILAFASPARSPQAQPAISPVGRSSMVMDPSALPNASFSGSIRTEEELMAEEMEQVMGMDTPTRTEFVISPPLSSYASSLGGRDSRASLRSSVYSDMEAAPPIPPVEAMYQTPKTHGAQHPPCQFEDAEERLEPADDVSIVMTELCDYSPFSQHHVQTAISGGWAASHPHPPPLHSERSLPNMGRPTSAVITEPHPPIPVNIELRALRHAKSTETFASDITHASGTTCTTDPSPLRPAEDFRPSRQELIRVAKLKERKAEAKAQVSAVAAAAAGGEKDQGAKDGKRRSQGTRPLAVVENARSNLPAAHTPRKTKGESGSRNAALPVKERHSKASANSGKENVRVRESKASTGSVPRPLRV